jgi:tRNA (guanine37-N1)-methyltransferase
MLIDVLSIFPEMFSGPLNTSILKRAQEKGLIEIRLHDIRDFTNDKHRTVDDAPYGGGAGMVMKVEPIIKAVRSLMHGDECNEAVILMTPQGNLLTQDMVKSFASFEHLIFICGHYEGIDERVVSLLPIIEVSIGDYVLTGGELPTMVVIDALSRMIPGVLGDEESVRKDSFYEGLLDYSQYTRPSEFEGLEVPQVLLSGNHELIRKWRRKESLKRTYLRRPDLLEKMELTKEDNIFLDELRNDMKKS